MPYKYLDVDTSKIPARDIDGAALRKGIEDALSTLGVITYAERVAHDELAAALRGRVEDLDEIISYLLKRGLIFVAHDGYIPTNRGREKASDLVEAARARIGKEKRNEEANPEDHAERARQRPHIH